MTLEGSQKPRALLIKLEERYPDTVERLAAV